ncbi:Transcriptional regulatory protein ZraR [Sporotomaculum syntrophicum]|uniref:Transcriptional regulatory protein ZraR n=1 Tax=Sporotomaculum syntrophicum TaxID=182264 RepID=A0A9D3AZB3_9FIRM|nr:sigma 54-interacting transcriptional regulator [Sporotomaculum syntrophicum]KAF1085709.1 Transcriptional regulatory protein ZraR [Sporotomaculum syntrophicum]
MGTAKLKLEDIIDSSSNAVLAVNVEGLIIYGNYQVEKFFGLPVRLLKGQPVHKYLPKTGLLDVLLGGHPQLGRQFVLNGRIYLSNCSPVFNKGRMAGAVTVIQDITETSNVENTFGLKETLANILELSNDGIIAIDRDYIITMVNQPFASLFGKKVQDLVGQHVQKIYQGVPIFSRSIEDGETEHGYVTNLNGYEITANRMPIKKDGHIIGALGIVSLKTADKALATKTQKQRNLQEYRREGISYRQRVPSICDRIIGQSPGFIALKETVKRVAQSNSTVLLRGESGTGKELFARAIHSESGRSQSPFVRVNCAAIPETLLESELFGYNEGAFTGAQKGGHMGKFEFADKGVIFLDEIGDMPLMMQAKLLRVLQEKEIERLGDTRTRRVDVRVIAATNRNLEEMIINGEFREDLYYRINVVTLNIPPLRSRIEDIELLVNYFIKRFNEDFGLHVSGADKEVIEIFKNQRWPGNLRELENVIERAFNIIDGDIIRKEHLPLYMQNSRRLKGKRHKGGLSKLVEDIEREAILDALEACAGNKNRTAAMLGISRAGLYKKLNRYKIY